MEKLGDESAAKFINALIKSVQTLCHGYLDFQTGVEIIGHINLSVDKGSSLDYILKEKVCKNAENSTLFISNSFHAEPKPDQEVSGKTSQSGNQATPNSESPDTAESGKVSSAISSISSALTESRERSRRNSGAKDSHSSHSHPNTAKRKASDDDTSDFRPAKISFHDRYSNVTSESTHPTGSNSADSKEALQALRTADTDFSETVLPQTASVRSDSSDIGVNLAGSVLEPVESQNNPELPEREEDSDGDLEVTFIKEEYVEGEGSACDFDTQQFARGPHQRASDGMPDPSLFSLGPQSSAAPATYVPSAGRQQPFSASTSTPSTSQPQPGPSTMRVHPSRSQAVKPLEEGKAPVCGYVHPEDVHKWEMYDLSPGHGVFIHRENYKEATGKRRQGQLEGKSMARYLMGCFWKQADLVGASIAENPAPQQTALDRDIITAILDFCEEMSGEKRSVLRNTVSSVVTKANSLYRQKMGMAPRKAGRPWKML